MGTAGEVRDRRQTYLAEVTAVVLGRSEQRVTGALYARVCSIRAWVIDDTGFRKDGKMSLDVARQYSGR